MDLGAQGPSRLLVKNLFTQSWPPLTHRQTAPNGGYVTLFMQLSGLPLYPLLHVLPTIHFPTPQRNVLNEQFWAEVCDLSLMHFGFEFLINSSTHTQNNRSS